MNFGLIYDELDHFLCNIFVEKYQFLSNLDQFKHLDSKSIDILCYQLKRIKLYHNQDIYTENDPINQVYFTIKGTIEVIECIQYMIKNH